MYDFLLYLASFCNAAKGFPVCLRMIDYSCIIDLFSLYILFSQCRSCDVPKGICLLSFHKLCVHMHENKTKFKRGLFMVSVALLPVMLRKGKRHGSRTISPILTAHKFSASRNCLRISGFLKNPSIGTHMWETQIL